MKKNYLLLTILLISVFSQMKAQLYTFLEDPAGTYASVAANTAGSNLLRVNGTLETPACGIGFNSIRHSKLNVYNETLPAIEFSITPDAAYHVNVSQISVDLRRKPKGPTLWRIAYSTDGGSSWIDNGSDFYIESSNCFTSINFVWDMDDFSSTSPVLFRMIGFGAHSSAAGVSTLKNIIVDGEVVSDDMDGDGYLVDVDCDDLNPEINPGAIEVCNGIDDNCNGLIDDGITYNVWYADTDLDGYGDITTAVSTCDGAPEGYIADSTDCNDVINAINPGAIEICNGIDDNCDGNIDEGIDLTIAISPTGIITLCKPESVTLSATLGFDSYQWYKNGSPLVGETAMNYTTNKPAYYQVEGIIGACTSGLSEVQAVAVVEAPSANILFPDGLDLCVLNPLLLKASYAADNIYQWYLDDVAIDGATNWDYYANTAGVYTCMITNASGCTRIAAGVTLYSGCRMSSENDETHMSIYPYPVNNVLTLNIKSNVADQVAYISIKDLTGHIIYEANSTFNNGNLNETIYLNNNIANGLYFVSVDTENMHLNNRFIVVQ